MSRNSWFFIKCTLQIEFLGFLAHLFVGCVTNPDAVRPELDPFRYCMRQTQRPSLRECIGRTAINFLQRFEEKENFTMFNDLVSTKDDKIASRSLVNFLDTDPVDFRGIMENAGAIFSQRSLEWHMDAIYPGLMFKIGPTADANSVAQFVLDPTIDERHFGFEEPSTARLLAKQYLLPFLLGLKFNLVALVPLLFAGITLLLKKSLFLAKFAIFVSSILGVGGALTGLGVSAAGGGFGGFGGFGNLFGGHGHLHGHALGSGGLSDGYFPGKSTVYNTYDSDELHHNSPYKRHDRKLNFEKPREYVARSTMSPNTPTTDRFYDYEKQMQLHNHSGKQRNTNGKLGPSAYDDEDSADVDGHVFKTNDRNGWKVVDIRV